MSIPNSWVPHPAPSSRPLSNKYPLKLAHSYLKWSQERSKILILPWTTKYKDMLKSSQNYVDKLKGTKKKMIQCLDIVFWASHLWYKPHYSKIY